MQAHLGEIAPQATLVLSYSLRVGPNAAVGEATNRASVSTDDNLANADATAVVRIEKPLLADAISIVGRVTSGACDAPVGVAGIRVVLETGAYALTDSKGFYHFEGVRPGAHVVQMDVESLPKGSRPASCGSTTRNAGSNISQFIESAGGLIARADFYVTTPAGRDDNVWPAPTVTRRRTSVYARNPNNATSCIHGDANTSSHAIGLPPRVGLQAACGARRVR